LVVKSQGRLQSEAQRSSRCRFCSTPAIAATTQPAKKARPTARFARAPSLPRSPIRASPPSSPAAAPGQQLPLHAGADRGQSQPVDPGRHPRPRRHSGRGAAPRRRRVGDSGHRDHAHRLQSRRVDRLEALRLSGDVDRVKGGTLPGRPRGGRSRGQLFGRPLHRSRRGRSRRADPTTPRIIADDESYTVGVGGSYRIARNLDVTGGVRYKIQRDRLEPLADQRRDSQAVYVGTAFRF
jgi:hypothetical protein